MQTIPEFSTIELLKHQLSDIGYTNRTIELNESNYTQFTSPAGRIWFTSNTHINYPFPTSSARTVSDKKLLAYQLADQLGVRIPVTKMLVNAEYELEELRQLIVASPLVVKPNNASLSHGLTLDVHDVETLERAIAFASQYSADVLIQEQVTGQEIRFVVLDGTITAALLRETPRLIGDGMSTIAQLLAAENEARRAISVPYLQYPELAEPLVSIDTLDLSEVLAEDTVLELGKSTMIRGGASVYNVLSEVDASYLPTVLRLATALGKGFVVVDMFLQDYRQPQTDDNYAFIEFNMSPVLKLCYSCRDGNNYDILSQLVPFIDTALHGNMIAHE